MADTRGAGVSTLGVGLFVGLAVLSVAAFAITRAARSGDDIVNTVELTSKLDPGRGEAAITFELTTADSSTDVLIIDPSSGSTVRAIEQDVPLDAGPQRFMWDGLDDEGSYPPAGRYAVKMVLGEQGREIEPPGRIRLLPPSRSEAG